MPHHNLADFEPCLGYATKGQVVGGIPLQKPLEGPQYHPQPHPLHSTTGKNPHAMAEMGKLDHLEERLRAIEEGKDYAFANLEELFLVPNIITPPKFMVSDFDKYKGTTCSKNHLKMYCWKMGAYTKDEELLIHFFQESLYGVAVTWYTNLEPSRVHSWKDLMVAFLRQYQYNFDIIQIGCNYRTYAKRGTNLSKNTPKGEETWQC